MNSCLKRTVSSHSFAQLLTCNLKLYYVQYESQFLPSPGCPAESGTNIKGFAEVWHLEFIWVDELF